MKLEVAQEAWRKEKKSFVWLKKKNVLLMIWIYEMFVFVLMRCVYIKTAFVEEKKPLSYDLRHRFCDIALIFFFT